MQEMFALSQSCGSSVSIECWYIVVNIGASSSAHSLRTLLGILSGPDAFEKNKVLTTLNHGFRSGYSCETQLLITINDLLKSYDKGKQIDMAILDISNAFDTSFWLLISRYNKQSSTKSFTDDLTASGRSFMWQRNSMGPSTVPCGTPESTNY
jgi:hypothetical protein